MCIQQRQSVIKIAVLLLALLDGAGPEGTFGRVALGDRLGEKSAMWYVVPTVCKWHPLRLNTS